MCGIFGISYKKKNDSIDFLSLKSDINFLTKKSQLRGSDTFGILVKDNLQNSVYKINEDPIRALNRNDYKLFLNEKLKTNSDFINIIGQTRLVTNGSKFSEINNQPLISNHIIGVHNGIFVNLELKKDNEKTKNYESIKIKSDSLKFYELLSEKFDEHEFIKNYKMNLSNMRGNYTIAFTLKKNNEIFLASNCGSLFYFYDESKNFFVYASEKKILYDYLKNSSFVNNLKIKISEQMVKQCINNSIMFNPKNNRVEIFDIRDQDSFIKIKLDGISDKKDIKTSTNYEDNLIRHSKLKRCKNVFF